MSGCFRILFCLLFVFAECAAADLPVNVLTEHTTEPLDARFEFYEDTGGTLDLNGVRDLPARQWTATDGGNAGFGFRESSFWIRLALRNDAPATRTFVLELAYPLLDQVVFHAQREDGSVRMLETGDARPFHPRDIDHPNILMRLPMVAGEQLSIWASVKTEGSMLLPLRIWQETRFFEETAEEQKFHFFYFGALTTIILINLAVFFTLRERLYLFYALAVSGFLLFFLTSLGFGQQVLFPDKPALVTQLFVSSMPILALFSLLFAREFMRPDQHSPKLDWALRGMIYFEYFNMVAAVVFSYNIAVKISAVSALFLFAVLFVAGPISWAAGRRSGMFFTIAWIPLTLGFAATAGRTSGVLPNNFLTEYAMQIGSGLEAFVLTLALADRLYREREEKINAQANSLEVEMQRHAAQSQLAEAMMRDPITLLSNRNRFEWLVNKTLKEFPGERFIVGVARVTRLSEITRTLGLASSERVLSKIAYQMNLEASLIPGVISTNNDQGRVEAAFQLSGDTIGVLIQQRVSEQSIEEYQAILKKFSRPIEMDMLAIELQPCFGAALYPAHGNTAAQLIRNAHVAMEKSERVHNTIGFYDEALDIYSEARLTLMVDLREALESDTPHLHYQPKLELESGRIVGVEALIRWQHPQRGFVAPDEFIPLAEETGVINKLTKWAFKRAVRDLEQLRQNGFEGSVSINISARDLLSSNLREYVSEVLQQHPIMAADIMLELTETAAMEDPQAGLTALKQLTSVGLLVSIDDFGAGYSSLSYLKSLPASEIKLDRSLVSDICANESSRVIVQTAIDMGHSLGYRIVAEGVEDKETFLMLKQLGCDMLQGYWFCKPQSLDHLQSWLTDYNPKDLG